jgi:hypothetical protein
MILHEPLVTGPVWPRVGSVRDWSLRPRTIHGGRANAFSSCSLYAACVCLWPWLYYRRRHHFEMSRMGVGSLPWLLFCVGTRLQRGENASALAQG